MPLRARPADLGAHAVVLQGSCRTYSSGGGVLVTGILGFIGLAFYLWPDVSLEVLWRLGVFIGIVLVGTAVVAIAEHFYEHDSKKTKKVALWASSPIWIAPYLLGLLVVRASMWVWDKYEGKLRSFWQFLEDRVCRGVNPIFVLGGLLFVGIWIPGFITKPLETAIVLGCLILWGAGFVGVIFAIEHVKDRRLEASLVAVGTPSGPTTRIGRMYTGVADTVKLGATYVDSKKKGSRICPFIEFEEAA